MTITEMALIVFVLAFVFLVIYLVNLICKATKTLSLIHKQLGELGDEPKELVRNVAKITENVALKMQMLDPIFRGISSLGEGLEIKASSLKEKMIYKSLHDRYTPEAHQNELKVTDIINTIFSLVDFWKNHKP